VGARAAAWIHGIDRFKEPDWQALETALSTRAHAATPAAASSSARGELAAPRAQQEQKRPWITPRPGWIRRR
jgi:hypothetical protein